ncbi:MAG: OpcA protein [Candidatus Aquiluna sp. XM-24bin5]|nr:MAG: OpcA protein [Candidatus Aquiluna sp. XM-24bin5]
MIVDMPSTTVSKIGKRLQELREAGGVVALGRVLTLIVETDLQNLESAVTAANGASKLHPSRIIVLAKDQSRGGTDRLDAEIRVGGDAGASEVVILRAMGNAASNTESLVSGLMLPDAPVVAWWPSECSGNPSESPIGEIASRRITDASSQPDPMAFLQQLATNYTPGDGDMSWTRITLWRSQLAALFDAHGHRNVEKVVVYGALSSPSAHLLAAWLGQSLNAKTEVTEALDGKTVQGIAGVIVKFDSGELRILRSGQVALISQPDAPESSVLLPQRSDMDCLVEDMRYLGEDSVYGKVLTGTLGS